MMEQWKAIRGFEGMYMISDCGNVKSLPRPVYAKNRVFHIKGKILKGGLAGAGYLFVTLAQDNEHTHKYVHRLVAEHFLDAVEFKNVVNHKDGNKLNNHVLNLEWCTHAENNHHAIATGLINLNERDFNNAKISEDDVRQIMSLKGKITPDELAKVYPITAHSIRSIYRGNAWSDVTGLPKKKYGKHKTDIENYINNNAIA